MSNIYWSSLAVRAHLAPPPERGTPSPRGRLWPADSRRSHIGARFSTLRFVRLFAVVASRFGARSMSPSFAQFFQSAVPENVLTPRAPWRIGRSMKRAVPQRMTALDLMTVRCQRPAHPSCPEALRVTQSAFPRLPTASSAWAKCRGWKVAISRSWLGSG